MSQFILTLDASQINEYLKCPLMWHYNYHENINLDLPQKAAPDVGTLVHKLLDFYYTLKFYSPNRNAIQWMNGAIVNFKEKQETKKLFPTDNGDLENFLIKRFSLYVTRWINDDFILPQNEVSPVELGFSKLLYENQDVKFIVEGRIDLINLIQDKEFCWTDHKSQDRISYLYNYTPQFKTYAWATRYKYGIINYFGLQNKYDEGKTFRRELITFSPEMINEWENTMLGIFIEIYDGLNCTNPEMFFYSKRNDSSCAGAFGCNPCQFTNICETFNWEQKQKVKQLKYLKHEPWKPW